MRFDPAKKKGGAKAGFLYIQPRGLQAYHSMIIMTKWHNLLKLGYVTCLDVWNFILDSLIFFKQFQGIELVDHWTIEDLA